MSRIEVNVHTSSKKGPLSDSKLPSKYKDQSDSFTIDDNASLMYDTVRKRLKSIDDSFVFENTKFDKADLWRSSPCSTPKSNTLKLNPLERTAGNELSVDVDVDIQKRRKSSILLPSLHSSPSSNHKRSSSTAMQFDEHYKNSRSTENNINKDITTTTTTTDETNTTSSISVHITQPVSSSPSSTKGRNKSQQQQADQLHPYRQRSASFSSDSESSYSGSDSDSCYSGSYYSKVTHKSSTGTDKGSHNSSSSK